MAKLDLTVTVKPPGVTPPSAPTGLTATPVGAAPPASTSVTLVPAAPFTGSGGAFSATGPIASGTTVGAVNVAPSSWTGSVALSGTNASSFALSAPNLITAAALAVGSYALTITATP